MKLPNLIIFILTILLFFTTQTESSHFIKQTSKHPKYDVTTPPKQYFQVTHPLQADVITPSCSTHILSHSFGNTYNTPPATTPYSPPPATCQWTTSVLEFTATVDGEQYDRIAGVWIDGVEVLRTSTAQPDGNGIFWKVRKDVGKYRSLFVKENVSVSVMLENVVNDEFTGVISVNVSLYFYNFKGVSNVVSNGVRSPLRLKSNELEAEKVIRKLIDVDEGSAVRSRLSLSSDELEAKKVNRKFVSDKSEEEGNAIRFPLSSDELEAEKVNRKFISGESKNEDNAVSNVVEYVKSLGSDELEAKKVIRKLINVESEIEGNAVNRGAKLSSDELEAKKLNRKLISDESENEGIAVSNVDKFPLSLSLDELEAKKVNRKVRYVTSGEEGNAVSNVVKFPIGLSSDELEAKKVIRKLKYDESENEGKAGSNVVKFPFGLSSNELEAKKVIRKVRYDKSDDEGNAVNNAVKLPEELEGNAVSDSVVGDFDGIGSELGMYPYDKAADVIVPISVVNGVEEGFWFRIESEKDVRKTEVRIDEKTYKAVLELYVSFHGDDEFWYMNPSDEYVEVNNLGTGRAHGAYREVLVTIDGSLVGAVVPFPVIFTGGINPLFWEPVVGIGAFDLPSYDIDLTPFLGMLLDGKSHEIGIQVADGISFWLVDANLHIWLDRSNVKAGIVKSNIPAMEIERENEFVLLDGEFEIEGERESEVTSWVNSSTGNLKTVFSEKISFKNKIKFKDQGTKKNIDQYYKRKTKIKITNEMGKVIESLEVKIKHPLTIFTETKPGSDIDTSVMTTKVEQERNEKYYGDKISRVLSHKQNCTGLMVVKGHDVLSGSADNHQNYNYQDEFGCYSRKVDVVSGDVVGDLTSSNCNNLY